MLEFILFFGAGAVSFQAARLIASALAVTAQLDTTILEIEYKSFIVDTPIAQAVATETAAGYWIVEYKYKAKPKRQELVLEIA